MPISKGWYLSQRLPTTRMKPKLLKPSVGWSPTTWQHSTLLRPSMQLPWEVEATHSASTREVEAACATTVREAEAARMAKTSKLWQAHLETMRALEDKALKEEKCSHQSFLWACGAALQACPNEALGIIMYSIHLLTGNMSLPGLLMAAPQLTIGSMDPIPSPSHPRRPATTTHPTVNKQQHSPRHEGELDHSGDGELTSHPRKPPQQRQNEEGPLADHLRCAHWEAFHKDSDLVKHIRQTYLRAHMPVFHKEVTWDLANIFGEMAKMAGLMGTKIHPVPDQWQVKEELHAANHVTKGPTKNLHYFWVVLPIKSYKIMGLKRIHSPEGLKHQVGLFLPLVQKGGSKQGYCGESPLHQALPHLGWSARGAFSTLWPILTECSIVCRVASPHMFAMMRS